MPELRHALRLFFREPAFSMAAIVVLALGIGAATAIFTLVESLLLATPAVSIERRASLD